ncbi:MAG: GH50 / CBM9, partial [uncultured Phycisphaerae bacterium]
RAHHPRPERLDLAPRADQPALLAGLGDDRRGHDQGPGRAAPREPEPRRLLHGQRAGLGRRGRRPRRVLRRAVAGRPEPRPRDGNRPRGVAEPRGVQHRLEDVGRRLGRPGRLEATPPPAGRRVPQARRRLAVRAGQGLLPDHDRAGEEARPEPPGARRAVPRVDGAGGRRRQPRVHGRPVAELLRGRRDARPPDVRQGVRAERRAADHHHRVLVPRPRRPQRQPQHGRVPGAGARPAGPGRGVQAVHDPAEPGAVRDRGGLVPVDGRAAERPQERRRGRELRRRRRGRPGVRDAGGRRAGDHPAAQRPARPEPRRRPPGRVAGAGRRQPDGRRPVPGPRPAAERGAERLAGLGPAAERQAGPGGRVRADQARRPERAGRVARRGAVRRVRGVRRQRGGRPGRRVVVEPRLDRVLGVDPPGRDRPDGVRRALPPLLLRPGRLPVQGRRRRRGRAVARARVDDQGHPAPPPGRPEHDPRAGRPVRGRDLHPGPGADRVRPPAAVGDGVQRPRPELPAGGRVLLVGPEADGDAGPPEHLGHDPPGAAAGDEAGDPHRRRSRRGRQRDGAV